MSLNAHLNGNIESVKFSSPWPTMAEETTMTNAVKMDNVCVSSSINHDAHGQVSLNVGADRLLALIDRLSQTHAQVDEYTRRRTEQISLGTQQIIEKILEETKEKQRELLFDAQQQSQLLQEQYQADLHAKINHLNEDKAQHLSQLEKHLNEEQESILIRARERIDWLQRDANQVSVHFWHLPFSSLLFVRLEKDPSARRSEGENQRSSRRNRRSSCSHGTRRFCSSTGHNNHHSDHH